LGTGLRAHKLVGIWVDPEGYFAQIIALHSGYHLGFTAACISCAQSGKA
jgi:hypothetical protein